MLAILIAPACAACDSLLEQPTAGCVCQTCWSSIRPITPPCCRTCGDALPSWRVASVGCEQCARCRRMPRSLNLCRAVGAYEGPLRNIIHALKYRERRSVAKRLAALMAQSGVEALAGAACAVPVPLHRRRRRERGFNQAALLAAGLGLPVVDALARVRDTVSQTALPAGRRHANVRNAFAVARGSAEAVRNTCVVLVDDVSTTGATIEACAQVLKEAGAAEVRAVIAARAVAQRCG